MAADGTKRAAMKRAKRDVESVTETHPHSRDSDRGFTTVEILFCIALMGIVMAPIMNAVISTVRTSSSTLALAQVETVLQNAADRVNRASTTCDYTVFAQAAAQTHGWAASQAVAVGERYVPGATPTDQGSWVAGLCEADTPADLVVQLITITVTSPDGNVRRTIEVVKSDV